MESRGLPRARRETGAPRSSRVSSPLSAVRARSSRVVRASSRAVRALFKRCSRVVRTLFALVVRTFNFQIRVACCVRVRTRCLHAVRTLLVRCSCAVRALFMRCLALRSKEAAPGRVGAIQLLHAKPLLLRAAGGHQQRAGELRGGNAAAFG